MKVKVVQQLSAIDPEQWNRLTSGGDPFLSHEFLNGLELTDCVCPDSGWEPHHLVLIDDEHDAQIPAGAAPLYLKYHSWGEFVFDWAWAEAYQRAGLNYYPKLLSAIPFTPVTGSRLLVNPAHPDPARIRHAIAGSMVQIARDSGVSSLHVLFGQETDNQALEKNQLIRRTGNQFHWQNRNYQDFEHYLSSFTAAKRKKIKRERRRVSDSGLRMSVLHGPELEPEHWQVMYRFYRINVYNHGGSPYLNSDFFQYLQDKMADQCVIVLASDGNRYVGGALNLIGDDTLYGRYWGAEGSYSGLHFETCYYQPIEFCIRKGLARFEAGAQGEHKLSRGLLPTTTHSMHWLRDLRFRDAVSDYLNTETEHINHYSKVLNAHSPFK